MQSAAALYLCTSGCQFFYSSALLHAQSRWLWLRVELNLVYVTAFWVGHSAKSSSWPPSSLSNHNHLCSLFPTLTCKFASPVPLISQPAIHSLFQPLSLFLPPTEKKCCCCGNRFQRGSLWAFQRADRSLYMAVSCLSTNRWVQPSMNIEPFNQTDGATDREAKRQQKERKEGGWTRSRLIIRSGSSCHVIVRPSNFCCTLQHRASLAFHLCTVALVMTIALKTHADTPFTSRRQQELWSRAALSRRILISTWMWTKQDVCLWPQQPSQLVPVEGYYVAIVEKKRKKNPIRQL